MNDYLLELIQKYRNKGVLIDTNVLVLYIIGLLDRSLIGKWKITSQFSENDFFRLVKFIEYFEVQITTPHILTEVSNLMKDREDLHSVLEGYIMTSEEKNIESRRLSKAKTFLGFGLADTAISEIARDSHLVVTNENQLFGFASIQKVDVVNLEQIRLI